MSSLARIQRDFCQSVQTQNPQNFLQHIKALNQAKAPLLALYHSGIYSVHTEALKDTFPLVFSIMERPEALLMARCYIRGNFPRKGTLQDWGEGFPAFIQSYVPALGYPCLPDIARYEWTRRLAWGAQENPLPVPEENHLPVDSAQGERVFRFQESCYLMAFSHPLEHIISNIQQKGFRQDNPPYPAESSYALILKRKGHVRVNWLAPSLFVFLNRLKEGQDSEVALAAARVLEPEFRVKDAFEFLFSHPILQK